MKSMSTIAKAVIAVIALTTLTACTGVGFVATADPAEKLAQSAEMMNMDRCLLAEMNIGDAMKLFVEKSDQQGIAKAYMYYGLLYKNWCYHEGKSSLQFKANGTYDGSYQKSIDNFAKAIELYDKAGNDLGAVNAISGTAEAYSARGDKSSACSNWALALERYRKGKASGSISNDRVSTPGFSNMGEVIEAHIKRSCPA